MSEKLSMNPIYNNYETHVSDKGNHDEVKTCCLFSLILAILS